jgi:hypothetical protein
VPSSSHLTRRWSKGDSNSWSHPERQRSEGATWVPPTYHNVLKELKELIHEGATPQAMRVTWAQTHVNLGASLRALGARTGSTARVEEAITAYRDALTEFTQERWLRKWAERRRTVLTLRLLHSESVRAGGRAA